MKFTSINGEIYLKKYLRLHVARARVLRMGAGQNQLVKVTGQTKSDAVELGTRWGHV